MSEDEMWKLNSANNIEPEAVELYVDFIVSLIDLIDSTYLGKDIMNDEKNQNNHFNWCWNKTLANFQLENIKFSQKGDHYDYFKEYIKDVYYVGAEKSSANIENIIAFWKRIMSIDTIKTKSEYDLFQEVYSVLSRNFFKAYKN